MALSDSLFPDGWEAIHQPVVKRSMKGRVRIERVLGTGKWNAETGEYDGGSTLVLYLGKARLDPVAKSTRREFVFDSADNQAMTVQLPFDENEATPGPFEWQSGDQVTVLDAGQNTMMIGQKMYVRGWAGSSNDWTHTLQCGFNSKQDG